MTLSDDLLAYFHHPLFPVVGSLVALAVIAVASMVHLSNPGNPIVLTPSVKKSVNRCWMSAEARFRTWSFISAAQQHISEGDADQAWRFLHRADQALGLDNQLDVNHPEIAKDYGGDAGLWKLRETIRRAKASLKAGKPDDAMKVVTGLDGQLFFHSLRRTFECDQGIIDPEFGVA